MPARSKTVRRKLTELILWATLSVLGLTLTLLGGYAVYSYRQATVRSLNTISQLVAENSAAVLVFGDESLAQEILGGLRVEREIAAAALYDSAGELRAHYPADHSSRSLPATPGPDGVTLGLNEVSVWTPVTQGDVRVGTVYLEGNLEGTHQRLAAVAMVLLLTAALSLGLSFGLSHYLQRRISGPLAELAAFARRVTLDKDEELRAVVTADDEIGQLSEAMNSMLNNLRAQSLALREQEDRFRALADNMIQLAWMTNRDGEFQWYNRRWHEYTGLNFEQSLRHGWDHVHPDQRDQLARELKACFASGRDWEDTFQLRDRHGNYRWFMSHAIAIRDERGEVSRWFGTNTDITELREMQQVLRATRDAALAASRAKDEFLAKLSHELRTPLNPVLLLVSDDTRNRQLPTDVEDDFRMIRNNILMEARLIDDLLDLTSVVQGKLVLVRRTVNLPEIVREAAATVMADAMHRNIRLVLEDAGEAPSIYADSVRMQQVFWNILKNAVKFSPDGGTVSIRVEHPDGGPWARVITADEGIGMTPQELASVFDAFAQGRHATANGSHTYGGLGLGLAIARSVVELHGGRIRAESDGPNCGSRFVVELPVSLPAPAAAEVVPVLPRAANLTRAESIPVLIVEDHDATRRTLHRLLARRGYRVTSVSGAGEARVAFGSGDYRVLISDIGLADGSGLDLMKEFRKERVIAGIAVSGYGTDEDVALSESCGFSFHLTKPITMEALEHAMAAVDQQVSGR